MESKLIGAYYKVKIPPGKHSHLLQIMIVIGSGILSSSAIATVLKAWLDNRKTTLTIQIDGEKKTLEYRGHYLKQDAATIQTIMEVMSENMVEESVVHTVTIDPAEGETEERYLLEAGDRQEQIGQESKRQAAFLRRLLPGWLQRG